MLLRHQATVVTKEAEVLLADVGMQLLNHSHWHVHKLDASTNVHRNICV